MTTKSFRTLTLGQRNQSRTSQIVSFRISRHQYGNIEQTQILNWHEPELSFEIRRLNLQWWHCKTAQIENKLGTAQAGAAHKARNIHGVRCFWKNYDIGIITFFLSPEDLVRQHRKISTRFLWHDNYCVRKSLAQILLVFVYNFFVHKYVFHTVSRYS